MPIASRHSELGRRVAAAVDARFAEPIKLSFINKDGKVDAARDAVEIEAVLRVGGGSETNLAGGFAQDWAARIAVEKAELHINAATYAGPQIRTGDRVKALSRRGEPWFEVNRVDDRGDSRIVLALNKA